MGTLALILIPAAVLVAVIAVLLSLRRDRTVDPRPWWGRPGAWVAISAAWVLIGVFVFPRLLGFTFILLPMVWSRALGRRRRSQRSRDD